MTEREKEFLQTATHVGWRDFFLSKGLFDEATLETLLVYAGRLEAQGLPVIFDLKHLCLLTGRNENYISGVLKAPEKHWREFSIPKRRGGVRQISAPYPTLLSVQLWIYRNILQRVKVSPYCHGFVRNRSILTNAKWHVGQPQILKLDLKDFFPSITVNRVAGLFKSLGYNRYVSAILARLCTLDGVLPQGAPTSPALSNLIAQALDYRLMKYAKAAGLHYTRYADDLTFSGERFTGGVGRTICDIVAETGFTVNNDKTRHYKKIGGERIVTGVSVGRKIAMPRKAKRRIRQELHYVMTFGLIDHIRHENVRRRRYLQSLLGRVNYWLMLEPRCVYALHARHHLLALVQKGMIDV